MGRYEHRLAEPPIAGVNHEVADGPSLIVNDEVCDVANRFIAALNARYEDLVGTDAGFTPL